ncbi:unnamed protein product [Vitrella brassicaformis CCMP3155]|uniref:Uncharacterized protein n=1 Tax=Vitrella brassicaformis (strain CCMP3155) TaxID=1169540 RepID=A0A0G4H3P3_VITBC|nr:unnamed protein product [Vitrella brassicaformis CCMP3155]|eukprot:CEM38346.1 unnamed protein product [Vitrella brassicaformis CCMP3155]
MMVAARRHTLHVPFPIELGGNGTAKGYQAIDMYRSFAHYLSVQGYEFVERAGQGGQDTSMVTESEFVAKAVDAAPFDTNLHVDEVEEDLHKMWRVAGLIPMLPARGSCVDQF